MSLSKHHHSRTDAAYMRLVGVALLLLAGFAVLIALPKPARPAAVRPESHLAQATPGGAPTDASAPGIPTEPPETVVASPAASSTPSPASTDEASDVVPTPTLRVVASRTPYPVTQGAHNWMVRPIGPEGWQSGSLWYPYASTGQGQYLLHHGIDLENPMNTPVLAAAAGEIVFAGPDLLDRVGPERNFYGNAVIIKLDRDLSGLPVYALYGHLNRVDVEVGQQVEPYQEIGTVGMTGIAIGPHLHFEVRLGENDYEHAVHPDLWLEPLDGFGTVVGRVVDAEGNMLNNHLIAVYRTSVPDTLWREVHTYIQAEGLGPDPAWNENFVMPDVEAGSFILKTKIGEKLLTEFVTVKDGETTFIEFRP